MLAMSVSEVMVAPTIAMPGFKVRLHLRDILYSLLYIRKCKPGKARDECFPGVARLLPNNLLGISSEDFDGNKMYLWKARRTLF